MSETFGPPNNTFHLSRSFLIGPLRFHRALPFHGATDWWAPCAGPFVHLAPGELQRSTARAPPPTVLASPPVVLTEAQLPASRHHSFRSHSCPRQLLPARVALGRSASVPMAAQAFLVHLHRFLVSILSRHFASLNTLNLFPHSIWSLLHRIAQLNPSSSSPARSTAQASPTIQCTSSQSTAPGASP